MKQLKKKLRMDDLKKEITKVAAEISWHKEQISSSLDYGKTARLKKEIAGLKQKQILLLKDLEQRAKQRALIKSRSKLGMICFRNGNRTKMI